MIIKEIKNLTLEEFEELRNIYLSTFPLKNAKQLDGYVNHIYDMLRYDNRYHLYAALEDRSMIGISLLYVFENLRTSILGTARDTSMRPEDSDMMSFMRDIRPEK